MAFQLKRSNGRQDYRQFVLGKASTQFAKGDAIEMALGIGQQTNAATDYVYGIVDAVQCDISKPRPATDFKTTTVGESLEIIRAAGTGMEFECDITVAACPIPDSACLTNTDVNTVKVTDTVLADNDLVGGQIYVPEIDQQRTITAVDETTDTITITVVPAFSRAPTVGDTARAVPFSTGFTKVKLAATNIHQRVGLATADSSGGTLEIATVDLARLKVGVIFPQLPAV